MILVCIVQESLLLIYYSHKQTIGQKGNNKTIFTRDINVKENLVLTNTALSVCRVEFEADGTGADSTDFTHGALVCAASVTY